MASVSATGERIIVKRALLGCDLLRVMAWQLIFGALPLFALSAMPETGYRLAWTGSSFWLLGFLALGGTALAAAVWYWLIQREEVGRLSLILILVPVAGRALGRLVFGECIVPIQAVRVFLILGGVATAAVAGTKTRRAS